VATEVDWLLLRNEVVNVFTPAAPVRTREFFTGRLDQLLSIENTINEVGRHALIYGERGVGKTSMVNILGQIFENVFVVRVPADSSDTYGTLWRKVFRRILMVDARQEAGFTAGVKEKVSRLSESVDIEELDPDEVVTTLDGIDFKLVVVIDEFDRLASEDARRLVADTIKSFSDAGSDVTVVIVGVAHDVDELIGEHPSIERNIRQIPMPRMSRSELSEILDKGFAELQLMLPSDIRDRIVALSQGFPHYAHLLGKYTAMEAIEAEHVVVTPDDFEYAIVAAIEDTHESIRSAYQTATITTSKDSIFPAVLLAAALAPEDEHGTFRATDMVEPLREITGKPYDVPNFTYNLGKLASTERGEILEKVGGYRPRYRFKNPLMKPYILMKGFTDGLIREEQLGNGRRGRE
jgi:hypothetical protein